MKPHGVLKVLSSNSFIDSLGYLHVVGEIQNGTTESVTYVKATATFYDKNNKVESTLDLWTKGSCLIQKIYLPINRIYKQVRCLRLD